MSSIPSLIVRHPTWTLLPASFVFSYLSLSLTPSFISLVFLITSLLVYTRGTLGQRHQILKVTFLWLTLTASISLSHLSPSMHALSTPSTSIFSLILLSGLSSAIALVPIYASYHLQTTGLAQRLVFPSLWATVWLLVSRISPIGRLITWTPLSGIDSYRWIFPFVGFAGLDWITATWASVAAEALGGLFVTPQEKDLLIHEVDPVETPEVQVEGSKHITPITGLLLALTVPSFFLSSLPIPPVSSSTTSLRVACILPEDSRESQLERFITETSTQVNLAKVLLWPESAVTFETASDKQQALDKVQHIASINKVWIGVSFEERVSGTGTTREGLHRNGMVLVGPEGVEMSYYKRKLVPIAESFSQIASGSAPPVHTIDLPAPAKTPKKDWDPSGTRAIPLSASICLDFSAPLTSLDSRPALILAPAKTWHTGVGTAMYELARARGEEIGADVLWCDGGAGGLSGVAGNVQVGKGTWVKTIGVPYPFPPNRRRTIYGAGGDWVALFVVLGLPALIFASQHQMEQLQQTGRSAVAWTRERTNRMVARIRAISSRRAIAPAPESELLIDAS